MERGTGIVGCPSCGECNECEGHFISDDLKLIFVVLDQGCPCPDLDGLILPTVYAGCEWTFIVTDHNCGKYKQWTVKKDSPITLMACPITKLNSIRVFTEQRRRKVYRNKD